MHSKAHLKQRRKQLKMQSEKYYILQHKRNPIWYWAGIPECLMYTVQIEEAKRYNTIKDIEEDTELENPLDNYDIIMVSTEMKVVDRTKKATQKLEDATI
jgi:hypothetical protein